MHVLTIGGGGALSAFRLDKLNARVSAAQPGLVVAAARFVGWTWNGVPFTQRRRACQ